MYLILLTLTLFIMPGSSQEEKLILIETTSPILKGALIDDYEDEALIIKITPPSRFLSDALTSVDKEKTPSSVYQDLLLNFGYLEKIYQKQYFDILESFQQMIITPYPSKASPEPKKFDITNISRNKRSPLRALIAFLRAIRPVARASGKLTKYGRFIKTLKYSGYVASAAVFAYEMTDIFGLVPDQRYDNLTNQLKILYDQRKKDLQIIDKVALVTMSLNDQIRDTTNEFKGLLADVGTLNEIKIRGSHLLTNYLNQMTLSLMILLQGKIPTFLMSLETQREWLESKINSGLLLYLSSISPHLPTVLKAIDEKEGQVVISVSVPRPDSRFQLLHYVKWEPKIWIENRCYSSPTPYFYLAYPSSKAADIVIKNPMLIDPRSCLVDGFLMCESDSLLTKIPDLSLNSVCSTLPMIARRKRSSPTYLTGPYYNLSGIVEESLTRREDQSGKNEIEIKRIREDIQLMVEENEKNKREALESLELAEQSRRTYKALFIVSFMLIMLILIDLGFLVKKYLSKLTQKSDLRDL